MFRDSPTKYKPKQKNTNIYNKTVFFLLFSLYYRIVIQVLKSVVLFKQIKHHKHNLHHVMTPTQRVLHQRTV